MRKMHFLASVFTGSFVFTITLAAPAVQAQQAGTTNVGTIAVQGIGSDAASTPGTGLMIPEDTPKQKSTATKAFIETMPATVNPFQALALLPGVNTTQDDAYGLSGGTLRVRGFDSSQMGFTIEGVPVNDSGNYAVYPQEYTDAEDLEEVFLTQGATDVNAPHIGASGGNVGIILRQPSDHTEGMVSQSFGQDNMMRTFGRIDSGLLSSGTKFFVSASDTHADKWKGSGDDTRYHLDFKGVQKVGDQSDVTATVLYNEAVNYNYRQLYLSDWKNQGSRYDFNTTPLSATDKYYYKLAVNPFKDLITTVASHSQLNDNLRLTVQPYFWYGYGNGCSATAGCATTLSKTSTDASTNTVYPTGGATSGFANLHLPTSNLVYYTSITETYRPGVQTSLNYQLNNHALSTGVWLERAEHIQTRPYEYLNASLSPNVWANSNLVLDPATGQPLQQRNHTTWTTVRQVFADDTSTWLNETLKVETGVRVPWVTRDGINEDNGVSGPYGQPSQSFVDVLPTLAVNYEFIPHNSAFFDFTKNMRAPSNSGLYDVPYNKQKSETSYNYDLGYRYQTPLYMFQGSLYDVEMYNRQVYNPALYTDVNVGATRTYGAELSAGARVLDEVSLFASETWTHSIVENNFRADTATMLPTKGKQMLDTPEWMSAFGVQWAHEGFFAGASAKYTSKRYSTLMNDESIPNFTTVDVNAGYHFPDFQFFREPVLKFNVTNLFGEKYLGEVASGFTANAQKYGDVAGSSPYYRVGAPQTISMSLSAKF